MATKGYDDSPPRNGIIFFYTILTVFMLFGIKLMLDSYFLSMMTTEIHDKVLSRGLEQVAAMREQEKSTLEKGSMPIEQAMKSLATRGRSGASPMIAPTSGEGMAQVGGWSQLKRETAAPAPTPDVPPPAALPTGSAPVEGSSQGSPALAPGASQRP